MNDCGKKLSVRENISSLDCLKSCSDIRGCNLDVLGIFLNGVRFIDWLESLRSWRCRLSLNSIRRAFSEQIFKWFQYFENSSIYGRNESDQYVYLLVRNARCSHSRTVILSGNGIGTCSFCPLSLSLPDRYDDIPGMRNTSVYPEVSGVRR
jgi:hypothetical protein